MTSTEHDNAIHYDGESVTAAQMLAVATRFHEPFATGELSLVDQLCAPQWRNRPRNPHEDTGREGWKRTIVWIRSAFADIDFTVEDAFVADDRVVLRTTARMTHAGGGLGFPATGKHVAFTALEVHRFEGPQVVESWHVQDYYGLMSQLGAVENVMGAQIAPYPAWDTDQ